MYNTIKISFTGGQLHIVLEERPSNAYNEYELELRIFIRDKDRSTNILMHADERFAKMCDSINEFNDKRDLKSLHVKYVFEQNK